MRELISIFLISVFILFGCSGTPDTPEEIIEETIIEKDINTFTSPNHGTVAIFPTFKYVGDKENYQGNTMRKYHVWEQKHERKYIIIIQLLPKEGVFPDSKRWISTNDRLFVKGMRAAYNNLTPKTKQVIYDMSIMLPTCFIAAQEVHVVPQEAIIRILVVPDRMCVGDEEPVMEELDRTAIINPLN